MGEAPGPDVWSGEGDGDDGATARPVALRGFGKPKSKMQFWLEDVVAQVGV